ncbi:hypothetical protein [uncultured Methanobrevibacter sp.]|uniref:hypothetical protein n=1 Tax=uncultured Methanobrevibacter sp. TaxID=253161 RepID=UPI0025EFD5AA|nr:hypothetical protein [uncultured Methanobrevibacter sp.]
MGVNPKMLTVEDANSIISHFGRGFCDYYELDTRDLTSPDFWFAYDFIDIYRTEDIIQFSINNSLWTLGYYVQSANINDFDVDVTDDRITITGSGLEWCVLVLELSPEFKYDDYVVLDFKPEFLPVIRPFYEDIPLVMGFIDNSGVGVSGLTVEDLISGETLTTDSDGLVAVTSDIDKHGEFDYQLETVNGGETVTYNFPFIRVKTELPVRLVNETVYRDKRNQLTFEFLYDNVYDITSSMLFNNNDLVLIVDNVEYTTDNIEDNMFTFNIPVGSRNELTMKLKIGGNDYLSNYDITFNVDCEYISFDNTADLKAELESESSASVVVYTGTELDALININKDVLVRFTDVVYSEVDAVFNVSGNAVLSLENCNFTGKTLVLLDNGNVNCYTCIIQQSRDTIITGTGNVLLRDCSFIDNLSCVNVTGELDVRDTLFDLSDLSYYDSRSPAFITVYGELNVDFCQFNIDLAELSVLGLGYVLMLIGKDSFVNGIGANELLQNEVFPVRKNVSSVDVSGAGYHIYGKSNKCMVWTVENTNTVFSNQLNVEQED